MKSSFQTILIIVFIGAFVVAVAVFSGLFSSGKTSTSADPSGLVTIWGVLPQSAMQGYINGVLTVPGDEISVAYEEHTPGAFAQDIIKALADGTQPDILIVSSELFSQFEDKLYVIPFQAYSERAFRDANIDGAQVFLTPDGTVALPLLVDPLVVYYNKDILASQNFVYPPATWSDLVAAVPLFTVRDARSTITQTAIAIGEWQNIPHFRDILSALFLQTGNPIITRDAGTGIARATLSGATASENIFPTTGVLSFYTDLSNPTSTSYTWNRALPTALDMFIAGKSAFYIGRASELFDIQAKNPNLNFDVRELFQPANATRTITFGSYLGAAVLKSAPNFPAAYATLGSLSEPQQIDALSKVLSLPPARRDLLLVPQTNPYVSVFFKAALSSFAWPDPNPAATNQIFRDMIQSVTSGRFGADTAVYEANKDLQSNIR